MFVFTLMQSRTHVDTAQIALDGVVISRHICWRHTMKLLGSHVTFVRRNSAAMMTLRNICFNINKLSRMFAVSVQGVSVQQLHWNLISRYIPVCSSFAVVNVVNILNTNIRLFITLRDVLMIDWVLSVFLIHKFLTARCTVEYDWVKGERLKSLKKWENYNSWFRLQDKRLYQYKFVDVKWSSTVK